MTEIINPHGIEERGLRLISAKVLETLDSIVEEEWEHYKIICEKDLEEKAGAYEKVAAPIARPARVAVGGPFRLKSKPVTNSFKMCGVIDFFDAARKGGIVWAGFEKTQKTIAPLKVCWADCMRKIF